MEYKNDSVFGVTQVAESEIVNIIDNVNVCATGWDEFKPRLYKALKIVRRFLEPISLI